MIEGPVRARLASREMILNFSCVVPAFMLWALLGAVVCPAPRLFLGSVFFWRLLGGRSCDSLA